MKTFFIFTYPRANITSENHTITGIKKHLGGTTGKAFSPSCILQFFEYKANIETDSYWLYRWSYNVEGTFSDSFQDLQTYNVFSDVFLGGAHGMQSLIPHVINLKTGKEIEESDLFNEGYEEPVADLIKAALQKEWGSPEDSDSAYSAMEEEGMVPKPSFPGMISSLMSILPR